MQSLQQVAPPNQMQGQGRYLASRLAVSLRTEDFTSAIERAQDFVRISAKKPEKCFERHQISRAQWAALTSAADAKGNLKVARFGKRMTKLTPQ